MAKFASKQALKNWITDRINENHARRISGIELQEILHDIIDTLEPDSSNSSSSTEKTDYGLEGQVDGTNTVFSTSQPYSAGSILLFLNGVCQFLGDDYIEKGSSEIQFTTPPLAGDKILAKYTVSTTT